MKRPSRLGAYYVLDADHHVVEVGMMEWAQWFEDADRKVAWTQVTSELLVSTVFLGLDHRYAGAGPPLLFETMIFGGPETIDLDCWRYSSCRTMSPAPAGWSDNKAAAENFEEAKAAAKELLPPDVGTCTFGGIAMKRNRAGSLTIKEGR